MIIIPNEEKDNEVFIMIDSVSKKRTAFFRLSQLAEDKRPVLFELEKDSFDRPCNPSLDANANTFVGFIESENDDNKITSIYVTRNDIAVSSEIDSTQNNGYTIKRSTFSDRMI